MVILYGSYVAVWILSLKNHLSLYLETIFILNSQRNLINQSASPKEKGDGGDGGREQQLFSLFAVSYSREMGGQIFPCGV